MTAKAQLSLHKTTESRTSDVHGPSSHYYSKQPPAFTAGDLQSMLKSHFNLKKDEAEEIEPEEEHIPETSVEEEKLVDVAEERVLQKSEISIRLSWLGKVAEGDG